MKSLDCWTRLGMTNNRMAIITPYLLLVGSHNNNLSYVIEFFIWTDYFCNKFPFPDIFVCSSFFLFPPINSLSLFLLMLRKNH